MNTLVQASSHREAPSTAVDPQVDATDVYAFVDPADPTRVTLIANFIPFQIPQGGPNFYQVTLRGRSRKGVNFPA
ncbi:MAG: DUF4331 family protein [Pyrinomonadaceae bacterium]